ncbi:unnamed protein product [marine sediment metagenome]|uniref:Sulfotransferase domain-containing protein n=1 Tax=marine sediment metagenome TaxID=412755 RepID=X0RU20_9ZZZZ
MDKIFGIGLPKTGHTSLTRALEILGYKSIKIPIACVNDDLSIKYDSLKDYNAWTDTPITMKYTELDKLYPDARFILLHRNIITWEESCSFWFSLDIPDYHNLHKSIFGSASYVDVYTSYYNNLFSYFLNYRCGSKYIILDICAEYGWSQICEFLNKDIPNVSFPHLNKREG